MVNSITGLTRNGVKDFWIQRISAVILALYTLTLLGYAFWVKSMTYHAWTALFHCPFMKLFTVAALLSLIAHAWIGMWTIFTDYVKCAMIRGTLMTLMLLAFMSYLIIGFKILWG
jgi:succinate dehydrogenase / fumarate reductase, membrane anchor subunit